MSTTDQHLPAAWDPAPLAAALETIAGTSLNQHRSIVFDFGHAGTITIEFDLDTAELSRDVADGLLAQLAQLSLLAAHQHTE